MNLVTMVQVHFQVRASWGHVLCSTCDEDCTNVNARLAKCGVFSDQRGDRKRENTFSHLHDVRRKKKGRRPTVVAEHEGSLQADAETWGENTRMRKLLISSVIHYNAAIMSDLMYSANSWRYCPGYAKINEKSRPPLAFHDS